MDHFSSTSDVGHENPPDRETCDVLVVGPGDEPPVAAAELRRHGLDVRLTGPDVMIDRIDRVDQPARPERGIRVWLRDPSGERAQVETRALVRRDTEPRTDRDAMIFDVQSPDDARNLAWKLAATLRGAPETLLDSYLVERAGQPRHYRTSRLSQELGGKRLRIRAGDRLPDATVWSVERVGEVRLATLTNGPRWALVGIGSITVEPLADVAIRLGDAVRTYVVGGNTSSRAGVTLLDRTGDVGRRITKRGGTILVVRPDGFLGLRAGPSAQVVTAYLEDLVPRPT